MYRTQMDGQQQINLDGNDDYEFSGATLKLSDLDEPTTRSSPNNVGRMSSSFNGGDPPAVLSGTDCLSPTPSETPTVEASAAPSSSRAVASTDTVKPKVGSPRHFFSFRSGLFEQATKDIVNVLLMPSNDTHVQGSWLLTEISHWDHEKERIIILTSKTFLIVKYDFIAMRILEKSSFKLNQMDKIVRGMLTYPSASLIPDRGDTGVRLMWNKGRPLSGFTSWNPFATQIPWRTVTDHPLFAYNDIYNSLPTIQADLEEKRLIYSVENFYQTLCKVFKNSTIESGDVNYNCEFEETPIQLSNYLGIGALVHNKHNFGFFKVRGKFSF